jgi:hypothetical protein
MLALRCLALSEDGRWDDHFDRLRRGEIAIPTAGVRRRRPRVARLPEKLRKTG